MSFPLMLLEQLLSNWTATVGESLDLGFLLTVHCYIWSMNGFDGSLTKALESFERKELACELHRCPCLKRHLQHPLQVDPVENWKRKGRKVSACARVLYMGHVNSQIKDELKLTLKAAIWTVKVEGTRKRSAGHCRTSAKINCASSVCVYFYR